MKGDALFHTTEYPVSSNVQEDEFPWKEFRLPQFVKPLHYSILIHPNLTTFWNEGRVNITLEVTQPTNFLVIHKKDINTTIQAFLNPDEKYISVVKSSENLEHEQLYMEFDIFLEPSVKYMLQLQFSYQLKESQEGFFLRSYTIPGEEKRYLATTQFEPMGARKAFPCFDEPAMKATFSLQIVHEKDYDTYFNTYLNTSLPYGNNLTLSVFNPSVRMSTYLVAFLVCDFSSVQGKTKSGVDLRIIVPKDQLSRSTYALECGIKILEDFEDFLNISYPLPKLDMVAIPDFPYGGMENWGLVFYAMSALLSDPDESSSNSQQYVAEVISHELAHQGFDSESYFSPQKQTTNCIGDCPMGSGKREQFVIQTVQRTLRIDSLRATHPVTTNSVHEDPRKTESLFAAIASQKEHIYQIKYNDDLAVEVSFFFMEHIPYDGIFRHIKVSYLLAYDMGSYYTQELVEDIQTDTDNHVASDKLTAIEEDNLPVKKLLALGSDGPNGATLILMLESFVGMTVLQEGITLYLNRFQYDNAATTDLWNSFGEVMDSGLQINISTLMDTWTWQKGFPVILVSREGGTLYVKQQRFLVSLPENSEFFEKNTSYDYQWHVPVTFITDKSTEVQKFLLSTINGTFSVEEDTKWIKLNVNQTGLYRVMYEEEEWRTFTEVLRQDHWKLHSGDRANLLDDGFSLARTGMLNISIVLDMACYLQKERNYIPWATSFSHFQDLSFLVYNTPVYPVFQRYVVKLLHPLVVSLGWKDEGSHMKKKLRSLALIEALYFGDKEVIAEGKKLFDSWKNNGTWIAPNLQKSVYTAGIIGGGSEEWQYLWDYLQNSTIPSERSLLFDVLSASTNTELLKRFLEYSLDSTKIDPQDKYKVITRVANRPSGHHLARNFLFHNWKIFLGRD
ncbi:endoplasmic reticulum aminopeptidase 1-like, partial [Limulus polyphemus]|uniref:Aminopeptidase n=1 Tax=Limulus polyphemus TaxID=6850 RepID=A0ABM1TJB5_LIMPO